MAYRSEAHHAPLAAVDAILASAISPALWRLSRHAADATDARDDASMAAMVTLEDGSSVRVREMNRDDAALDRDFVKRLSPEASYMRFFGMVKPSTELMRTLTDLDYRRDMAFVALAEAWGGEQVVGVSRYAVAPDGKTCECAITVRDDWQGRGLAVTLMRLLIEVARQRGVTSMVAVALRENDAMHQLAEFLGFKPERNPEDSATVLHRLVLRPARCAAA